MAGLVRDHDELRVFARAFEAAMRVFEVTKSFPREERYSLTDQIRRSSRSVCANIAEAWRKRLYEKSFIAKLSDAQAEAAETQVWVKFALRCNYMAESDVQRLHEEYNSIVASLSGMIMHADKWCFKKE